MTDKGVSESLLSLEVGIGSGDKFLALSDDVYNSMKENSSPLHRSMYAMIPVVAQLSWKEKDFETYRTNSSDLLRRSYGSFTEAYKKARRENGQPDDPTRIENIIEYSVEMYCNPNDTFPPPILRQQGNELIQVDGARRLMARLLAGQDIAQVYVVVLRENIKDFLDQNFLNEIGALHNTKKWFNSYQSIMELGLDGTRKFSGRFPSIIDLSRVKGHVVADFGCSNGMALLQAYYCGADKCIGFDCIPENVEIINKIASHLGIPVEAHQCDFNDDNWEKAALEATGAWDYSMFFSVYMTKELKNRERLLQFIWENSRSGMFFEGNGPPMTHNATMYTQLLGQLEGSCVHQLPVGIIERPYDSYHRPKFFVEKT